MGLHLHSSALEAWLTSGPGDYDDPLAGVEFPRETRNPRKIDRDRIRFAMRCVVMDRGPFKTERGFTHDLSPRMRAAHLNGTAYERLNLRVCTNSAWRRAELLRTWRCKLVSARECRPSPLPSTHEGNSQ